MTDDFFDLLAPAPTVQAPPTTFAIRTPWGERTIVRPVMRIGDEADSEGEHVRLEIVDAPDRSGIGHHFRAPLRGGPKHRKTLEGEALAVALTAPTLKDALAKREDTT